MEIVMVRRREADVVVDFDFDLFSFENLEESQAVSS